HSCHSVQVFSRGEELFEGYEARWGRRFRLPSATAESKAPTGARIVLATARLSADADGRRKRLPHLGSGAELALPLCASMDSALRSIASSRCGSGVPARSW